MSVAWVGAGIAAVGVVSSMSAADAQASAAENAANQSAASAKDATQLQGMMYDQTRADQKPWRAAGNAGLNELTRLLGLKTDPVVDHSIDNFNAAKYIEQNPDAVAYMQTNGNSAYQHYIEDGSRRTGDFWINQPDANNQSSTEGYGSLLKNFSMADYEADPGYAFRVSEGQKALERSAAARGGLYSGRAAKDLTRFGQDQGSQEYQNAFNRFQSNQNNQYNRLASLAGVGQTANNALSSAGSNYANSVGNIGMTNAANQGNAALAAGNARASGYTGAASALGNVNWGGLLKSSNSNSGYYPDTYAQSQGQLYGPPQQ